MCPWLNTQSLATDNKGNGRFSPRQSSHFSLSLILSDVECAVGMDAATSLRKEHYLKAITAALLTAIPSNYHLGRLKEKKKVKTFEHNWVSEKNSLMLSHSKLHHLVDIMVKLTQTRLSAPLPLPQKHTIG